MRKLLLILLALSPFFLQAQDITIDERINDIYYLNGKVVTKKEAWKSSEMIAKVALQDIYSNNESAMLKETHFDLLYNSSYGFYIDVFEAFNQKRAEHKYYWIA
jgi:hypothetical protein